MGDQQHHFPSALSSTIRVLKNRPPPPNNAVQAGISSSSSKPPGTSPESLANSSGTLLRVDGLQTMDESSNEQPDKGDDDIRKHVAFQSLPRSRDAGFNAAIYLDNLTRHSCTDGTRVDIIAQIMAWLNEIDPSKASPVYFLIGLAGLGKTTIAYTICELLNELHLPFTSFFCSRQLDSKNSKLIVTTLCHDLSELFNSYGASVSSVLETNSKVVNAGLRIQIDELLVKPWQASIAQRKDGIMPTAVVVVDALDENDRGTEFLEELLRVIHAGQLVGIKFLVTSRPHPRIVDICRPFPPNAVCILHEVVGADSQSDIAKYLREALPELKDEPELLLLSKQARGLFIYAATAVKFISPPYSCLTVSEMRFHLQAIVNDNDERSMIVDGLYEQILSDAFRDARVRARRLQILHTIVCAESRINISVLADLTNTEPDTVVRVVDSLSAVLFVSPKDDCVYWYHDSFPDFVFSRNRAKFILHPTHHVIDVFCDAPTHHGSLARRCFSVMQNSLHFNMCNLPSSYVFDSEVPGLYVSIEKTFPPTLRYVLGHWARHLLRTVPAERETDDLLWGLRDFLCNKLLFWIEAMNLIGRKYDCPSLLKDAASWVAMGKECPDLLLQLTDARNFTAFFAGSPASKSTPHLYISGLCVWNQDSTIWGAWRQRFRFIPSASLPEDITIPLMSIPTSDRVICIAFSPDGNRIVSGSWDKSVRVWDAKTGYQLRELQGHTDWVTSVAFSPDGSRIVSGSEDKSVRVWDARTGRQSRELQGHIGAVNSVAFSPDCNRIMSGSCDKSVRVWDATTGEQLGKLQGHTDWVTSVAFSPDGSRIVSGSEDKSVRVWDARTGRQSRELQGHIGAVNSVAFSPDGSRIVSGSEDESVRVWDAKPGEQLRELRRHTGAVNSVAFSSDGNQITSGSCDKSVRMWDAKTGGRLRELQGHTNFVNSVAFSPDGNRIVSGSDDRSVRVWDATTGEQLEKLQGHTDWVTSVAFSPDGSRIVSGSEDKSVRVWDARSGKQSRELQGHTSAVNSVAFSFDGNRIVSASCDKSVRVWGVEKGDQLGKLQGHTSSVTSVAFSPDGNRIVSGSWDKSVRVWDAKTGYQLRELQGHTNWVTSVAFLPDGDRIVSCSYDRSVQVWDEKTGAKLRELQGHTDMVTSVAFSDGNRIVSGSWDKSVRVWDIDNLDPSWFVKDGWIKSGTDRLVWLPSTICNVLLPSHNLFSISLNRFATISFTQSKLGTSWHECYTP